MQSNSVDWQALVGQCVLLNTFGIARIVGVTEEQLLTGEGPDRGVIPLAAIRSVCVIGADGSQGPLFQVEAPSATAS